MSTTPTARCDVVIIGGGHNGLTAAAYLAKAGRSVVVLERLDAPGGAAVSALAFPGLPARLSRYSYLVSLLPRTIIDDLGLDVKLVRRRYSSYTPVPGHDVGLLIDRRDDEATSASFGRVRAAVDAQPFAAFYADTTRVAEALWPTVTEPLISRRAARARLADDTLWHEVFERPVGEMIEARLQDDLVRGVAATDALIGTFASMHDAGLAQNRCFLYHVIGGGTGDWDVPVGGMGQVTGRLADAARAAGATILTGSEVLSIDPDGAVSYVRGGEEHTIVGTHLLVNAAPAVLTELLGDRGSGGDRPEGAQVKVNLLLERLPRLRDSSVSPRAAFGGTFHINETYGQLEKAYTTAAGGDIPDTLPCEIYCHSLTDPSILGEQLAAAGAQTLTVFGLHTPHRLLTPENNDEMRARLQQAVLASIDSVLTEPIEDVLMTDAQGRPCIETKTTLDIENALNMPGGNIFHGPLSWPFVEDDTPLDTPARRWGVATEHDRILLCGAGAIRGGAVSGLGGHNAAMAVLESPTG